MTRYGANIDQGSLIQSYDEYLRHAQGWKNFSCTASRRPSDAYIP